MSVDLFRRAAAMLREHATEATPGPWEHVSHGKDGTFMGCGEVITMAEAVLGGNIAAPSGDCYARSGYSPFEDMAYIVLMHPPVALAVADLLEAQAQQETYFLAEFGYRAAPNAAIALARAILREEAPDEPH